MRSKVLAIFQAHYTAPLVRLKIEKATKVEREDGMQLEGDGWRDRTSSECST